MMADEKTVKDQFEKFGQWLVDQSGNLFMDQPKTPLTITHDRLIENDWLYMLRWQPDFNWSDFMPAYLRALEIKEIKSINLIIDK